jgi:hypothetical protein
VLIRPQRRPVPPPTLQAGHIPAPTGGINTVSSGSRMPEGDCPLLYNMIAAEYGDRVRLGCAEWVTGITGAADNQIRSTIAFTGSAASGANNRLFAVTSSGIWDVSSSTTTPTISYSFLVTSGRAGYGTAHVVVTAGGHFLVYCDEENGLIVYTESGGTWAAVALGVGATEISGVDPINLAQGTVFKGRLWFVEKNTANLWYSVTGSLYGAYTKFTLGTKLRAGGSLVGVWNWTYDGGNGVDDSLVAISDGGDVVIYQGTDPSSASTFGIKGVWFAGAMPAGRQVATALGGDMAILSRSGIIPLSKLVLGAGESNQSQYYTAKIANLFNQLMLSQATIPGWAIRLSPEDNALLVMVPSAEGTATTQLAMSLATGGWSQYRDLPIYSAENFGGTLYFGSVDGKVYRNTGNADYVSLADGSYTAIQFAGLTRFEGLGNGRQKRVQLIKPKFLHDGAPPTFSVSARYDYNLGELDPVTYATAASGGWDDGEWDDAIWGGTYNALQEVRGAVGIGTDVAVGFRGASVSRTVLIGFDVLFDQGGFL